MSDPWEDSKNNTQHLTDCDDDGCERCQYLIDGFYMACDYCGSWGLQESDGWVMCRAMIFCDEKCRDDYWGEDASNYSETEPVYDWKSV